MATRYDLIVPRPGKDDKTFFVRIGTAWENAAGKGFSLTFDALPMPDKEGVCRVLMRIPQDRDAPRSAPQRSNRAPVDDLDDGSEIPF